MKENQFLSLKIGGWYIFYRISIQMFLNHSPKEILNGILWGLIFGPIQSSLSLEIWSIPPPRYILTNQDSGSSCLLTKLCRRLFLYCFNWVFFVITILWNITCPCVLFISGVGSKLSQIKWNSGKGIPADFMTDLCSVNLEWMKFLMRI